MAYKKCEHIGRNNPVSCDYSALFRKRHLRKSPGNKGKNSAMTARLYAMESLASLKTDAEKATNLRGTLESFLPAKDQIIKFSKALENFAKTERWISDSLLNLKFPERKILPE